MEWLKELRDIIREDRAVSARITDLGLRLEVRGTRTAYKVYDLTAIEQAAINPFLVDLPELRKRAGGLD